MPAAPLRGGGTVRHAGSVHERCENPPFDARLARSKPAGSVVPGQRENTPFAKRCNG